MFAGKQQRCRTFLWTGRTSQITATLRFDFTKIQIGGKDKWLITKQKKNIDGTSGKQRKRRSCVSRVWMKRRSRSSAFTYPMSIHSFVPFKVSSISSFMHFSKKQLCFPSLYLPIQTGKMFGSCQTFFLYKYTKYV